MCVLFETKIFMCSKYHALCDVRASAVKRLLVVKVWWSTSSIEAEMLEVSIIKASEQDIRFSDCVMPIWSTHTL